MVELTPAQLAVLSSGLPGEQPTATVTQTELDDLVGWAFNERLSGVLWHAVSTGVLTTSGDGETLPLDLSRVREAHVRALGISLAAEATAVEAVRVLRAAGVTSYLFKGLATAHLDYPDPSMRTFFDADLVVARDDLPRSVDALMAVGFERTMPPVRRKWEARFARAVVLQSPSGVELDLHASIATGYFGEILDHQALMRDPVTVTIGGEECLAFGPSGRLLCSCYAVVLSRGPRLRLVRDLAQQLLVSDADWSTGRQLAGDGEAVLARAVEESAGLLNVTGLAHWSAREGLSAWTWSPSTGIPSRALELASCASTEGWSADARSTFMALRPTDRIRFLLGIAAPSKIHVRARGMTRTQHFGRTLMVLGRARPAKKVSRVPGQ